MWFLFRYFFISYISSISTIFIYDRTQLCFYQDHCKIMKSSLVEKIFSFLPPRLELAISIRIIVENCNRRCVTNVINLRRYCLWAKKWGESSTRIVPSPWTMTSSCPISLARQKYSVTSIGNSSVVIYPRGRKVISGLLFSAPASMASASTACIEKWQRSRVRFCWSSRTPRATWVSYLLI